MTEGGNHHDSDGYRSRSTLGRLGRRGFLGSVATVGTVSVFGAGAAGAQQEPFVGPFGRAYSAETIDPSSVPQVTSVFGGPDEGEGEENARAVPKKAPEATGSPGGSGGSVQRSAPEGRLVEREFDGLTALDVRGVVPSDAQVAAGDDALFEAINSVLAAYDKDGTQLTVDRENGPAVPFQFTLDDWFRNVSPFIYEEGEPEREGDDDTSEFFEDYIIFDPRARYDPDGGRFLLSCVDYALAGDRAGKGALLLSVSSTSDPRDPWYNYRIPPIPQQNGIRGLVDYDQLGYDGDAIYLSQNFFPGPFSQATMVALDKDAATNGSKADANHFTRLRNPDGSPAFTVQPVAKDDGTSTGYFVNSKFFQGQTLTVWTLEDPLGDPALSNEAVRVRPYTNPPAANQPDTEEKIATNDDRIRRVSWDGDALWTAHAIDDGRVRWYGIDPDGPSGPSVAASGSFKRNGEPSFFPAIESTGDATAFVYNATSPRGDGDGFVDVEVASVDGGEVEAVQTVKAGENDYDYQNGEAGEPDAGPQVMRWGDYSGISVDPDGGSFWVVSQYAFDPGLPAPEYVNDDFYATRIAEVRPD